MNKHRQQRKSLSISQTLSGVLIGVFGVFTVIVSLHIGRTLESDFGELQQQDFERRMSTYATLLDYFINVHRSLLVDLSMEPVLAQSVMQPHAMRANLNDHMSRIRIMGKQAQMRLLDFEGAAVYSRLSTPVFDYRDAPWLRKIMAGDIESYFGIHKKNQNYFLTFATAILYNEQPEGVLLTEIPISALAAYYKWPNDLNGEQLLLFYNNEQVLALGPNISHKPQSFIDLPEYRLRLVGHLNNSGLRAFSLDIQRQLVVTVLVLVLMAIVAVIVLSRKLFIDPIERLRATANAISKGQFYHPAPSEVTRYKLREINALSKDIMSMAEIINSREHALKGVNNTLEERVQTRTKALQIAHDVALDASRAKSEFLATMSHEIRTPMNAVLGILGLLREERLSEKQQRWVRMGRESGELLLTIINDILDFSKMEADKLELEQISFNLPRLLNHTIELLNLQAKNKELTLVLSLAPDLPRYAKGDPDRFRQVLINLINNAIKFTPKGGITVKVTAEELNTDTFTLHCEVHDTGIGIAKVHQKTLFDEFTMADQSHARKYEGTGLGLAICKRLVSLMGGTISLSSEQGKGTVFAFDAVFEVTTKQACLDEFTENNPSQMPAANTRVLLVEDNPANQMVIKSILERAQLKVDLAANGEEGINAVRNLPYDIVLMDISMPGMDGMAATHAIRQLKGKARKIPIVALTAHALSGDRQRFLDAGMDDYLSKPIDRVATLHCIARWTAPKQHIPENIVPGQESYDTDETTPIKNTRVLLVEDNVVNQMIVKSILEYAQLQVDVVGNGQEAVDAVIQSAYDIVLMDISMPVMDGMTATRTIRQLPRKAGKTPIVALTADVSAEDRALFLDAGMNDHLSKPVDRLATLDCIARWTDKEYIPVGVVETDETPASEEQSVDVAEAYVDDAVLRQLVIDTSAEIVPELLTLYIDDGRQRVAEIERAISENDVKALEFETHTLGSSAAAHGNAKLYRLARKIEHLCQAKAYEKAVKDALKLPSVADKSFRLLAQEFATKADSTKE